MEEEGPQVEREGSQMKRHYMLPGQPIALPRQRFTRHGRSYKPASYLKESNDRRFILKQAHMGSLIDGPVSVTLEFYSKRPQRLMRKGDPDKPILKPTRPDVDNLCKAALDHMTGTVIADDALVVRLSAADYYCDKNEQPYTTIIVEEIK